MTVPLGLQRGRRSRGVAHTTPCGVLAFALLGVAGCRSGPEQAPPLLPALAGISTVLRLPTSGGHVSSYRPDSLSPTEWRSDNGLPPLRTALGFDLDERIVWALDTRGRLIGIDLASGGWRAYHAGVRKAAIGAEGSVFVVDSAGRLVRLTRRSPTTMPVAFRTPPASLWGAIGGQAIALTADSGPSVRLITSERAGQPAPAGAGPVAPTFWGEMVALADRNEVRLIRSADGTPLRTIHFPGAPTAITFSPSAHRLYALVGREVVVADRFTGDQIGTIALPGPGRELRVDPSGRWMLVHPPDLDSAWVLDLATSRRVGTVATGWRADLPLVAGAATLVVADGQDAFAVSLASSPPRRVARIPEGANDLWLAIPWVPPRQAETAIAAAESAFVQQDSALAGAPEDSGAARADEVWLQISSSQNPDWARDLADQLKQAGHPAAVWRPDTPEEGYRVVVGPFRSRDLAEEAGRALARPYFVVRRSGTPR